jgi:menaquinone-dependent protoporphyrinogen IX oxidase
MKTLVAFATKSGVTGESAEIIAEVLEKKFGHDVDRVNLMKDKPSDINSYDNIFIGSGIRIGRWYGSAKRLLKKDYGDRNVALFVSACSAGDPEKHEEAVTKYLGKKLEKHSHLHPVAAGAFGGRMRMGEKDQVDTFDPEKVRAWAEEVGDKLK